MGRVIRDPRGRGRRSTGQGVTHDRYYQPDEWSKLTPAQRSEIYQKREGEKRKIDAISTTHPATVSSVTTNTATTNQTATTSGTGDQMSRRTTARTIDAITTSNRCNGDSQRAIFKM